MIRKFYVFSLLISLCLNSISQPAKRPLRPGDIYRLKTLSDANISPDGQWIAYTMSSIDSAKDKRNADIWMVIWDGKQNVQLTNSSDGESSPRWSPRWEIHFVCIVKTRRKFANLVT